MNGLALFAGAGGLELGLHLALGDEYRTVCFVEREAYAAATLAARMGEGRLDPAPIWDDVSTFDGKPWRGVVDLVSGGFPCQDISNAGKRAGIEGARSGLWSEYSRILGEIRPRYVFVENVAALVVRGLERVLADLAALGFDAEWGVFRASDAGAPHRRERLFLLAHARRSTGWPEPVAGEHRDGSGWAGERREDVADARRVGEPGLQPVRLRGGVGPALAWVDGQDLANAASDGRHPWWAEPALVGRNAFPPGPSDLAAWDEYLEARPGIEPAVRRGADGLANRVDRLRLTGNGVVPQQAAHAFRELARRAGLT